MQYSDAAMAPLIVVEAVVILDYAKSSGFNAKFGNAASVQRKEALADLVESAASRFCAKSGPKDTGDGYFLTFGDEVAAVSFAVAILKNLPKINSNNVRPEESIHLRFGVTFGELYISGENDRKGEVANLCARLESLKVDELLPDESSMSKDEFARISNDRILVSGEVYDGIKNKFPMKYAGLFKPKDIHRRYETYLVGWDEIIGPEFDLPVPICTSQTVLTRNFRELVPNTPSSPRFLLRGMDWYEEADSRYLHGRETEILALRRLIIDHPIVRLIAPSGAGKSSVLRAGLLPSLRTLGWRGAVVRPFGDPASTLLNSLSRELLSSESETFSRPFNFIRWRSEIAPLLEADHCNCIVLLIDQTEDILSPYSAPDAIDTIRAFLSELYRTSELRPMIKAVLAYRTDADARLGPIWQQVSGQPSGLPYFSLMGLDVETAERILTEIAQKRGWHMEVSAQELAEQLLTESSGREVYPPYLQILVAEADSIQDHKITRDFVAGLGGVTGIIGKFLKSTLQQLENRGGDWRHARSILSSLSRVTGEKLSQTRAEIAEDSKVPESTLAPVIDELVRLRLVRPLGNNDYEVQHDRLAAAVVDELSVPEREFKAARELLSSSAGTFARTNALLTMSQLHELFLYREKLQIKAHERRLLLHSVLAHVAKEPPLSLGWCWLSTISAPECIKEILPGLSKLPSPVKRVMLEVVRDGLAGPELELQILDSNDLDFCRAILKRIRQLPRPMDIGLLERLSTFAVEIRVEVAKLVSAASDSAGSEIFRKLQRDEHQRVRIACLEAAITFDATRAVEVLSFGVSDKKHTVWGKALEFLATLKTPEAEEALRKFAASKNLTKRKHAIKRLVEIDAADEKLLVAAAGTSDYRLRLVAAEGLGRWASDDSLATLTKLARDKAPTVRARAFLSIAEIGSDKALAFLKEQASDPNAPWRKDAVTALGFIARSEALSTLRTLAETESDVSEAALHSITKHKSNQGLDVLLQIIEQADDRIRQAALFAIQNHFAEEFLPALRSLLLSPNIGLKTAAAKALLRGGLTQDLQTLRKFQEYPEPGLRAIGAQSALRLRNDDEAISSTLRGELSSRLRILEMIKDGNEKLDVDVLSKIAQNSIDDVVTTAAVNRLSEIGTPKAVEALQRIALRTNYRLARFAVSAMGLMKIPEAVSALRHVLEQNEDVCEDAVIALYFRMSVKEFKNTVENHVLSERGISAVDYVLHAPEWWQTAATRCELTAYAVNLSQRRHLRFGAS
jgi:HEAT repeat protein